MNPNGQLTVYGGTRGTARIVRPNMAAQCIQQDVQLWHDMAECGGIIQCCAPGVYNYGNAAYQAMPPGGRQFRRQGIITVPPDGDGDTRVLTYRTPLGYWGVIKGIYQAFTSTGFVEGSGSLTWRLKIGERYVQDYSASTTSLGTLAFPYAIPGGVLIGSSNQLIQYSVLRAGGASLDPNGQILVMVSGWYYPIAKGAYAAPNMS